MITCPFCQKEICSIDNRQDFICPTQVIMFNNGSRQYWQSHYIHKTWNGESEYWLFVLSFQVCWNTATEEIAVYDLKTYHCLYRNPGDFQDFVKVANKFSNLKAFL